MILIFLLKLTLGEICYKCKPEPLPYPDYWIPLSNDTHYEFSSSRSNRSYIGRNCALAEYGLLNKSDPANYVDCGEYACWTMVQVYSLVKNPTYYEQPDLDGNGARDLDPIGKLERACSRTKSVDAPQYERRGTPWTTLDQCETVSLNIQGSAVVSLYRMYLCTWSCRGDFCNTHLLGWATMTLISPLLLLVSLC